MRLSAIKQKKKENKFAIDFKNGQRSSTSESFRKTKQRVSKLLAVEHGISF